MILVKKESTNSKKCKVRKFELITDFEAEEISLINAEDIPADQLYKTCNNRIEELNRRLERCRLIQRAIECSFNKQAVSKLPNSSTEMIRGKTKGRFISVSDSDNGIFIH